MSTAPSRRLVAAALAGALLTSAATPAGAQEQRSALARMVRTAIQQLENVVADKRPPPERPPATLRPCTELYNQKVLEVARGPELATTYDQWLLDSYQVMREVNGELPFPICFRWRAAVVDTNLGRYLLDVNSHFMEERFNRRPASEAERRFYSGYVLTGYLDPAETDTALAHRRADLLQARLPGVPCQFVARAGPAERRATFYRKVYFTFRPAIPACPRNPN